MPDLQATVVKIRSRSGELRALGVDVEMSLGALGSTPVYACIYNGIIIEAVLKDIWRRIEVSGDPDKKMLEDLLTQVSRALSEKGTPIPKRTADKLRAVQATRNRLSHHSGDSTDESTVVTEDAAESLSQLAVVLDWYFEKICRTSQPAPIAEPVPAEGGPAVIILYKRDAQPDAQVLTWLEAQLRARGCRVFIDRHMGVGVEWAVEIDRQIRGADFVIVLLSAAAVASEMIVHEVETAHAASAAQPGKARLLPVRVAFADPLPPALRVILDKKQQFSWLGPQDNAGLIEQVHHVVLHPDEVPAAPVATRREPEGGAVQIDSQFYVVRPVDDEVYQAIGRRDGVLLVKGPRQIGKTSLLSRALAHARGSGFRVALTDFQALDGTEIRSAKDFWLALGERIADQLGIEKLPHDTWRDALSPNRNFERYFRSEVLEKSDAPLLWAMDEADRIFPCEFSGEVFGLFRTWYNARALEPAGPWRRLMLAIVYATEADLFIKDLNQSPFNIGTRFMLRGFTHEEVADLNRRYGGPLRSNEETERFHRLTGGQPFLVRRGLREMADRQLGIAMLEAVAAQEDGPFGDQLKRVLVQVCRDASLTGVVRDLLGGRPCGDANAFYILREIGVLAGDSPGDARWRCELYGRFLRRHLG